MKILAVDDESCALDSLVTVIGEAESAADIHSFFTAKKATQSQKNA